MPRTPPPQRSERGIAEEASSRLEAAAAKTRNRRRAREIAERQALEQAETERARQVDLSVRLKVPGHPAKSLRSVAARFQTRDVAQGRRILQAPGGFMRLIADFLVSPKVFRETFEPLIADLCAEWQEAVIANRAWKARWIRARYWVSFVMHFAALGGVSFVKMLDSVGRLL